MISCKKAGVGYPCLRQNFVSTLPSSPSKCLTKIPCRHHSSTPICSHATTSDHSRSASIVRNSAKPAMCRGTWTCSGLQLDSGIKQSEHADLLVSQQLDVSHFPYATNRRTKTLLGSKARGIEKRRAHEHIVRQVLHESRNISLPKFGDLRP